MTTTLVPNVPWIDTNDIVGCADCLEETLTRATSDQITRAIRVASEVLFNLSGRQYEMKSIVGRPCCSNCLPFNASRRLFVSQSMVPFADIIDGHWYNFGFAGIMTPCVSFDCGGGRVHRLDLGVSNVIEVTEVKIAGEVLDTSAYRLDAHRWLYRVDGVPWPTANKLDHTADDPDGWSVTMTVGHGPTSLAKEAASELACQLILRMLGDKGCRIPERAIQRTTLGQTVRLTDLLEIVKHGGIGLYICDLFLNAVNPEKLVQRPRVVLPRRRSPYTA